MKKLLIYFISFAIIFSFPKSTYATDTGISCNVDIDGQIVKISGVASSADETNQITLLVGSADNIIFIDQIKSSDAGEFLFSFKMPDDLSEGVYPFQIGNDAKLGTYYGTINYNNNVNKTINKLADINVIVFYNGVFPVIQGYITCEKGQTLNVYISNRANGSVILRDSISADDGRYSLNCQLQNILSQRIYDVNISLQCDDGQFLSMYFYVVLSSRYVDINGNFGMSQGVSVDANLKTNDINLVDVSKTITGSKNFSYTLPSIIMATTYNLSAECFETVYVEELCQYTVPNNKEFMLATTVENITSFNDVYSLVYDKNRIEATSLYGMHYTSSLKTGAKGDVRIISYSPGKIVFKVVNKKIPTGKNWSGVLNVFKFKFKDNYSGETHLILSKLDW